MLEAAPPDPASSVTLQWTASPCDAVSVQPTVPRSFPRLTPGIPAGMHVTQFLHSHGKETNFQTTCSKGKGHLAGSGTCRGLLISLIVSHALRARSATKNASVSYELELRGEDRQVFLLQSL